MTETEELIKKLNSVVTEQGVKISGQGLIINKMDEIMKFLDKLSLKLYYIEKKLSPEEKDF